MNALRRNHSATARQIAQHAHTLKLLARKAISLTSGQSESLNPASFTGPLGDSGSMSFVQGWFLQNTGEDPVAGTLRLNFGNSEFLEVRPGAFVSGAMPQRAATQTGWDASTSFVVDCVGGSGTTSGILVITGNPSA